MSTNYECYKKLRLVAVMAEEVAIKLAATMVVVDRMLEAIQW